MSVSVVIPTKNRARLLGLCLKSLVAQTKKAKEVIIVDNGSTDNTKKTVFDFKERLPLKYIFEPKPGISLARNCGIKKATGKIIAFLDDDCQANRGWIKEILSSCRGEISVFQGRSLNGLPNNFFSMLAYFFAERNLRFQVSRGRRRSQVKNKLVPILGFFDTKNVAIKKEGLSTLGYGFDEGLKIYGEDVDLGIRLRKAGFEIFYNPKMIVTHYGGDKFISFLKGRFNRGWGFALLERKWEAELKREKKLGKFFKEKIRLAEFKKEETLKKNRHKIKENILRKRPFLVRFMFSIFELIAGIFWRIGLLYGRFFK